MLETKSIAVGLSAVLMLLGCQRETARSAVAQTAQSQRAAASSASVTWTDESSSLPLRRLWSGSDFNFYASSPSPDGRYVTELDWSTGNLAIRDLATHLLYPLTGKTSWDESVDYAEGSRFSPDGRRIAYVWFAADGAEWGGIRENYEIRVLDFSVDEDGIPRSSPPRTVYPGGPLLAYWLFGWSEDDQLLLGVYRPDNTTALATLSVSTGQLRVLKSFDWREARAAFSADGRWVAYDHPSGRDEADRDIHLLSLVDLRETTLIGGPGNDVVLGWAPEDGSLLFQSDRSGSPSIWSLPVNDGEPTGQPALLKADARGIEPLGFAGDSFYFGVVVATPSFRTATIDFDGRQIMRQAAEFKPPRSGEVRALAWSPDGEHVIHDVHGPRGTWVYVRTADGRVVRDWMFDVRMQRWVMRWAPDGQSVFLPAVDKRGRDGIQRIDLASGVMETIRTFASGETDRSFAISPDGRTLYFARVRTIDGELDEDFVEIVAHDLDTAEERAIRRVGHRGPVVASPDGQWLAYKERGPGADPSIQVFPVAGGEGRILHRVDEGNIQALVDWTPDGEWILFVAAPEYPDPPLQLWRVSSTTGYAEQLGEIPDWRVDGPALHPDGRTIAYRAGRPRGEIWALDGLGSNDVSPSGPREDR